MVVPVLRRGVYEFFSCYDEDERAYRILLKTGILFLANVCCQAIVSLMGVFLSWAMFSVKGMDTEPYSFLI